jgi:hypothetical protein
MSPSRKFRGRRKDGRPLAAPYWNRQWPTHPRSRILGLRAPGARQEVGRADRRQDQKDRRDAGRDGQGGVVEHNPCRAAGRDQARQDPRGRDGGVLGRGAVRHGGDRSAMADAEGRSPNHLDFLRARHRGGLIDIVAPRSCNEASGGRLRRSSPFDCAIGARAGAWRLRRVRQLAMRSPTSQTRTLNSAICSALSVFGRQSRQPKERCASRPSILRPRDSSRRGLVESPIGEALFAQVAGRASSCIEGGGGSGRVRCLIERRRRGVEQVTPHNILENFFGTLGNILQIMYGSCDRLGPKRDPGSPAHGFPRPPRRQAHEGSSARSVARAMIIWAGWQAVKRAVGADWECRKRAESRPTGVAHGTAGIGRRAGIRRYAVSPPVRPKRSNRRNQRANRRFGLVGNFVHS